MGAGGGGGVKVSFRLFFPEKVELFSLKIYINLPMTYIKQPAIKVIGKEKHIIFIVTV